jgi:8-hydroxy-5-deazaflavin:NADPH oxidoreductase
MRIGLIGAGHIGGTLARLFVGADHVVAVSNSRGPDSLAGFVSELGERARAVAPAEAAAFGEVVVVSLPFGRYQEVPAEALAGKIVIDTNNYYPDRDGHFPDLDNDLTTSSEMLQVHLAGTRVVKAFNTLYARWLAAEGRPAGASGRTAIPIAGDDPDAKGVVSELIDEIGFDAVDLGGLAAGRRFQPGTALYAVQLTRSQIEAAAD